MGKIYSSIDLELNELILVLYESLYPHLLKVNQTEWLLQLFQMLQTYKNYNSLLILKFCFKYQ